MKNFFSKYSQGLIVATLFVVIAAGVASANWPITSGFIRNLYNGNGAFNYGYGFGIAQLPGYGYGYDFTDRDNHSPFDYAGYGFVGSDGAGTISNIVVTQTTATVDYSTSYLAKTILVYADNPQFQDYLLAGNETSFNSGSRTTLLDNLTCGTTYSILLNATDAGSNDWQTDSQTFTTSACDSNSGSSTTVVTTGSYGHAQTWVQPGTSTGNNPAFPESPRLEYSDFGPGPKLLQVLLNHLGFTVSDHGAGAPGFETQFFGPKTKAALKKFQKAHGLNPDGIYGDATKAAMMEAMK